MLTGLYAPTSGTIIINGKNLQTDLATVRRELGVCPQQDVLFDDLTVREHLLLFASVKAPHWTQAKRHQHICKSVLVIPPLSLPCPVTISEGRENISVAIYEKKQLTSAS